MATSNSSASTIKKKYSDQFEDLYKETVLKSPLAKQYFDELTDTQNVTEGLGERLRKLPQRKASASAMPLPVPKSRGVVQKYLLSPVAKIIQQMKMKANGKGQADQEPNIQLGNDVGSPKHSSKSIMEQKRRSHDSIPSFDCSDISSDMSSDMSDDEQEPTVKGKTTTGINHKTSLHSLIQKQKSPEKQTPRCSSRQLANSKPRTPTGNELHIPESIKDLQKSLTPEFHAMARSSCSPASNNDVYRNKKIYVDENQSPKTCNKGSNDQSCPDVGRKLPLQCKDEQSTISRSKTRKNAGKSNTTPKIDDAEKNKPSQEVKTPSTQTGAVLQKSTEDDETPKHSKITKSTGGDVVLDDWFIQMVPKGHGIRVQGHRSCDPPDSFWNSSLITGRIDKSIVTTKSGTKYKLIGKMDRLSAREEGFSTKIVKQFHQGFPVNWKECLAEFLHEDKVKTVKPVPKKIAVASTPVASTPVVSTTTPGRKADLTVIKKSDTKGKVTPVNTVKINELPRSSSGRMIKPPLAYWTNQRIRHNISTDSVEIIAGGTNYLSHNTSETKLTGSTELTPCQYKKMKRKIVRDLKKSGSIPSKSKRPKSSEENDTDTDDRKDEEVSSDSTLPAGNQDQQQQKNVPLNLKQTTSLKERAGKRKTRSSVEIIDSTASLKGKTRNGVDVIDSTTSLNGITGKRRTRHSLEIIGSTTSLNGNAGKRKTRNSVEIVGSTTSLNGIAGKRRTRNSVEIISSTTSLNGYAGKRKTRSSVELINSTLDEIRRSSISEAQATDRNVKQNKGKLVGKSGSEMLDEQVSKDPPSPPRKHKLKTIFDNLPGTIKSPLYYSLSPDPVAKGSSSTPDVMQPVVGCTPSVVHPSLAALSSANEDIDTPRTAHLKSDALEHTFDIQLSDVKKKMSVPKTLGSSPLDLQREVMSVVLEHKQKRLAKKTEKQFNSNKSLTRLRESDMESSDVYDVDNVSDNSPEVSSLLARNRKKTRAGANMGPPSLPSSVNDTESDSDFTVMVKSKARGKVNTTVGVKTKPANNRRSSSTESLRRSSRNRSSSSKESARNTNRTVSKQNMSGSSSRDSTSVMKTKSANTRRSSSLESLRRSSRNRSTSTESVQRNLKNRSSSTEGVRKSATNTSTSKDSVRKSVTNRNRTSSKRKTSRSSSRESVRKSARGRKRTNNRETSEEIQSSDCDDQKSHVISEPKHVNNTRQSRSRTNKKKQPPKKSARRTAAVKSTHSESDDSFTNTQIKHTSDMSSSRTTQTLATRLPARQSKLKAAKKMQLTDSESSSSEMVSLKAKTQPTRTILKAKRAARNIQPKMQPESIFESTDEDFVRPTSRRKSRNSAEEEREPVQKEVEPSAPSDRQKTSTKVLKGTCSQSKHGILKNSSLKVPEPSRMDEVSASTGKENATARSKHDTAERNDTDWSPEELAKLKSAVAAVKPDTSMYWQCVATRVGSKSAQICQQKYQESLEKQTNHKMTNKKKTDDIKQTNKEPVQLTAKKGTMKRKRQLREFLEQHNQGHEADYFSSTPFKIQNKRIKISASLDSDDEDEANQSFKTPGSTRFKTPSVRPWKLAPLSDKKTPHNSLLSPLTTANVERNHIDTYINIIQKKKKKGRTLLPQTTPMRKKKLNKTKADMSMEEAVHKANAAGLFDARPASDGSDSEGNSDYYWSDGEQD